MNQAAVEFALVAISEATELGDKVQLLDLLSRLASDIGDDRNVIANQIERATRDEPVDMAGLRDWATESQLAALRGYQRATQRRRDGLGTLNREKARTAADRLSLGRRLYCEGMSGEQLRRAYSTMGEAVSLRTAERDLKKLHAAKN